MSNQRADEEITIYSDYVCPFCYLGRESLRLYQETRERPLAVDWGPFDLRAQKRGPDGELDHSVADGKDEAYYEQARKNVRRLQERYDVEMELDIASDIDSFPAQVISAHLQETVPYESWLAFDVSVFDALWQEGRDVGDREVLVDLAADVGVDAETIHAVLDDGSHRAMLREQFEEARDRGISGVPTFVYDGHAARGAVPPEQLKRLVEGA